MNLDNFKQLSIPYDCIKQFYGDLKAKRSGVPLMNHIDEGLVIIMKAHEATPELNLIDVLEAYCIHPLIQDDKAYVKTVSAKRRGLVGEIRKEVLVFAIEYRHAANSFLSKDFPHQYRPSPFPEVSLMLIADKVQNRKDFIKYHRGTHPHSERLDAYFREWMEILHIDEFDYQNFLSQ